MTKVKVIELASYGGAFSDGSRAATLRLHGRNASGHLAICQTRQQDGDDETCTCRPDPQIMEAGYTGAQEL